MNNNELMALAAQLKNDPRFAKILSGKVPLSSLISDPQTCAAVEDLAGKAGTTDARAIAGELLDGPEGEKIRAILNTLQNNG